MNCSVKKFQSTDSCPVCFATLDSVFPMSKNGLRKTPKVCFACAYKTDCLKTAMEGPEGLKVKEEFIDRAYESGIIGFFKRWSGKKYFYSKIIEKKKNSS